MGNFETLPDGTVRRWLDVSYHADFAGLVEQRPRELYPQMTLPVLTSAWQQTPAGSQAAAGCRGPGRPTLR
ncbi:MAG: hypothetical protein U0401_21735 [Anaerolineae bacterium]